MQHISGFELALLARAVLTRNHCPGRPLPLEGQRAKTRMRLRPRYSTINRRPNGQERTEIRGGTPVGLMSFSSRHSWEGGYEDWPGMKANVAGGLQVCVEYWRVAGEECSRGGALEVGAIGRLRGRRLPA
ncbi:uncharacterized protein B0H18DRAFT_1007432 [Fomitopsis serialis]|uniref:uncharacterized protein n=1 Tax=Fomitopsis serialis TaxID=139415 RepID=UPI002007D9DB|nr:uncharacterized protein B0H18DRAFT_1007432 [Neoantrodia serialis]KAH9926008.1 hypothetical protein B0H18DRAFT_1007432 [Neoantrodia serialis]